MPHQELAVSITTHVRGEPMPYWTYKGVALIPESMRVRPSVDGGAQSEEEEDGQSAEAEDSDATEGDGAGCTHLYLCGYWFHVLGTINVESGQYSMYLNGTLLYNSSFLSTSPSKQPRWPLPGGYLQLGAQLLSTPSQPTSLMAKASASFSIDVFRVYNRSLSAVEVAGVAWAFDPPPSAAAALILHWRFDEPEPDMEVDLSGRGNHGVWGASASLDSPHVFRHRKPDGVVYSPLRKPRSVMSVAPVIGASIITAQVFYSPSCPNLKSRIFFNDDTLSENRLI
jgi:hypothetical protein